MIGSISLSIENDVTRKETNSHLIGIFSEEAITPGWVYDRRLLTDLANSSEQYFTTVGGHSSGLLDGFSQEDWASGIIQGINFNKIMHFKEKNISLWVPTYKVGTFSIFKDIRRLYSDHSHMGVLTTSPKYDLSFIGLRGDCKLNTISVGVYKRLKTGLIITEKAFDFVTRFTGELDGETRKSTSEGTYDMSGEGLYGNRSPGYYGLDGEGFSGTDSQGFYDLEGFNEGFNVQNFSSRHNEYTIRGWGLYLNGKYEVQVGFGNMDTNDVESTWESHNPSAGGYIFLSYLNVKDVTVAVNTDSGWIELLQRQSLDYIDDNTMGYVLDPDTGVIQVTGLEAEDISLRSSINAIATSIPCYYDEDFIALPERGIVKIDNEFIAYQYKGLESLEDCVRGSQGTEATTHVAGANITFQTRGKFLTGDYWVKYTALPRIDYEITTSEIRTANKTTWLDVHPFTNMKSNKIIQIVSSTVNLKEIVLTTDEQIIGGTLYGPIYFGTDVGHLTATAYDASGNPVEDIELTLQKLYGPGTINSAGNSIIGETNSSGELYGYYNAPYEEAEVSLEVSDIQYDGSDTVVTVPRLPTGVATSEVFIYQVLKHDPTLGTVGKKVKAIAGGSAIEPWGMGYIECRCEPTEDFNLGALQIVYAGIRYSFNIKSSMPMSIPGDEPVMRFYLEEYAAFLSGIFTESTVWLYQSEAEIWDPTLKRGASVILYEWSTNYTHPKTKAVGAYGPVHPDTILGTTLRFKGRHLPIPAPTDDNSNLGAYTIVSPAESRFVAYGRDPYSGSIITSNELRFRVSLPNTLTGVDTSGVLPVPYGFTFISDDFNIGAGLGGSNFITINPTASGINQLTLRGSI